MNTSASRIGAFLFVVFAGATSWLRALEGTSVMTLSSPVTPELSAQARRIASDSLRSALLGILMPGRAPDERTDNPVVLCHIDAIADTCREHAKKESTFRGHEWVYSLKVPDDRVDSILAAYRTLCKRRAEDAWKEASDALRAGTPRDAVTRGVRSLFNAAGMHTGTPMTAEEDLRTMTAEARREMTELLSHMKLVSSQMVISGTPGKQPRENLTVTALLDSIPFVNLHLKGYLPGGRQVFSAVTDRSGSVSLAEMSIPYVARGTFFHIHADFGPMVGNACSFGPGDLGLQLKSPPELMLIFKVTEPSFSLEYRARSVSDLAIPEDFARSDFLTRVIVDSCHMRESGSRDVADVFFEVACQASKYAHEQKEEVVLKVEAQIRISAVNAGNHAVEHEGVVHEVAYEAGKGISLGLFFWESADRLKSLVKDMVTRL